MLTWSVHRTGINTETIQLNMRMRVNTSELSAPNDEILAKRLINFASGKCDSRLWQTMAGGSWRARIWKKCNENKSPASRIEWVRGFKCLGSSSALAALIHSRRAVGFSLKALKDTDWKNKIEATLYRQDYGQISHLQPSGTGSKWIHDPSGIEMATATIQDKIKKGLWKVLKKQTYSE